MHGRFLLVVLALVMLSACMPIQAPAAQPEAAHDDHEAMVPQEMLGTVDFTVDCTPEAQAEFNRATALLHSFMFAPAIQGYNAVLDADPTCAMAHWGIAVSQMGNPFAWPPSAQALTAGWAAVEQGLAIGPKNPREEAYLNAVTAFYRDAETVDHRTRALAYEQAMADLAAAHSDDLEAQIFYALALDATALPTDKTYANQMQAISILEEVYDAQPDHPGVTHYLIHSNDYPSLAAEGLDAAMRYAEIAPDAAHAVHMPSHIFTRLGHWQESIDSNRRSAGAAMDELSATHEQGAGSYNALHAMDYLVYAHLQLGQDAKAQELLDEIATIEQLDVANFVAAYALAAMPARYVLERGQWEEAAALSLPVPDMGWERFPQAEAVMVFARGLGAARAGDVETARRELERLQELKDAMLTINQGYFAGQADIQMKEVEAWIAFAEGDEEGALALMREAAAMEDQTEKHPVTPGPFVPAHEMLGEMLLEAGQPAEALAEFEASQALEPNRFRGWYLAGQAAEQAGDAEAARAHYEALLELAAEADMDRPETAAAQEYLSQ
jgi:tetratricopeptide (TPR) repeat protein